MNPPSIPACSTHAITIRAGVAVLLVVTACRIAAFAAAQAPSSPGTAAISGALHPQGSASAQQPAPTPARPSPLQRSRVTWFAGGAELHVPAFYDTFAGVDLSFSGPEQRERFLHWVNTELCTCGQQGCRRDTIANCVTNDALCPRAPVRLAQILDRVRKGETLPSIAAAEAPTTLSPQAKP